VEERPRTETRRTQKDEEYNHTELTEEAIDENTILLPVSRHVY